MNLSGKVVVRSQKKMKVWTPLRSWNKLTYTVFCLIAINCCLINAYIMDRIWSETPFYYNQKARLYNEGEVTNPHPFLTSYVGNTPLQKEPKICKWSNWFKSVGSSRPWKSGGPHISMPKQAQEFLLSQCLGVASLCFPAAVNLPSKNLDFPRIFNGLGQDVSSPGTTAPVPSPVFRDVSCVV